ncbi:MAG: hypothetical protein AAFU79_18515, partial [Myxococcota bacterium]
IETQVEDLSTALVGERTRRSRNEPAPWSISQRLGSIVYGHWHSQAEATATHQQAFAIAKKDLAAALTKLKAVHGQLSSLEKELEAMGAPWTPSRIPSLPADASPTP